MNEQKKPLVVVERLRESTSALNQTKSQAIGSDRGRILFSAPVRRLQSKAQVFSLESNAAVRSRLTHSMEVSHIGRYVVQKVAELAESNKLHDLKDECVEIESIVETACLLHDVGNTPFGHLGESAIQEWFKKNALEVHKRSKSSEQDKDSYKLFTNSSRYQDYLKFDGNPQGLRICMTLQGEPGKCGFNLTLSQIASLIKYPVASTDLKQYDKIGVFTTELESLKKVWRKLGLDWGQRFPLVYLMEAADDIAYCLSDIEDGIEKNITSENAVMKDLKKIFPKKTYPKVRRILKESRKSEITRPYVTFRTKMINALVLYAADRFVKEFKNETLSDLKSLLSGDDEECRAIYSIKQYCRRTLYRSAEAEDIEIAGYNVVYGILDKYKILLELSESDFNLLVEDRKGDSLCCRMFSKLPDRLVEHYKASLAEEPNEEWYHRLQLIIDYVAGMTDEYALSFYRLINGIDVDVI